MTAGRQANTTRRHQRVLAAVAQAIDAGDEVTVASIARRAGFDRTFCYRHRDLLEHIRVIGFERGGGSVEQHRSPARMWVSKRSRPEAGVTAASGLVPEVMLRGG